MLCLKKLSFFSPGALSESEQELEQDEVELPQEVNTRGLTKGQSTKLRFFFNFFC